MILKRFPTLLDRVPVSGLGNLTNLFRLDLDFCFLCFCKEKSELKVCQAKSVWKRVMDGLLKFCRICDTVVELGGEQDDTVVGM